jgi:hypothetical protein
VLVGGNNPDLDLGPIGEDVGVRESVAALDIKTRGTYEEDKTLSSTG